MTNVNETTMQLVESAGVTRLLVESAVVTRLRVVSAVVTRLRGLLLLLLLL